MGGYNFQREYSFILDGLESLTTVSIGAYSFESSTTQKSGSEVVIRNCQNLISLSLQEYAFRDFQKLTLTNLTSLQSITTNQYSFYLLSSFEFSGKNYMEQFIIVRPAFVTNNEFRPL